MTTHTSMRKGHRTVCALCQTLCQRHGPILGLRWRVDDYPRMGGDRTTICYSETWQFKLKLDELIRSASGAHNALLNLEELTRNELNGFLKIDRRLADEGGKRVREGSRDTGTPEVSSTQTSTTRRRT